MHSLKGAPNLHPGQKKSGHRQAESGDDYSSPVDEVVRSSNLEKKKTKHKKHKKTAEAAPAVPAPAASFGETEYEDDFETAESLGSDDYIPSAVESRSAVASAPRLASEDGVAGGSKAMDLALESFRQEREAHERRVAQWNAMYATQMEDISRREKEVGLQVASLRRQEETLAQAAKEQTVILAQLRQASQEALAKEKQAPTSSSPGAEVQDTKEEDNLTQTQRAELQRRRQRERERALSLRRAQEESAAHSLFQRLAQDVREVFHELNLSVVAAEKERLLKDERYRKEREMKDRREEMERAEKLQKELREREEREAKFWALIEQREEKFRMLMQERLTQDDSERQERWRRELEDRAEHARKEGELRDRLEHMEKERQAKSAAEGRERDHALLQGQFEEMQSRYQSQLSDFRRDCESNRAHSEELHRLELERIQRRHEAAVQQLMAEHAKQLAVAESHAGSVSKLESLLSNLHTEMVASKRLSETLVDERLRVLEGKERHLGDQKAVLDAVLDDLRVSRQELDKERARVAGLYAKFDLALADFTKNAEEDRRQVLEAQSRHEILRQQLDKDRRLMLAETMQERKALEQQFDEFLSRKMESMAELQAERTAISRERNEATLMRERQNRDETELLKSLRLKEEQYASKIESLEADRLAASQFKLERQQMLEQVAAERDALAQERQVFEREKEEILGRFEEVQRRALEAASAQENLRMELVHDRNAKEFDIDSDTQPLPWRDLRGSHRNPKAVVSAVSNLQMNLARQRTILQKISR